MNIPQETIDRVLKVCEAEVAFRSRSLRYVLDDVHYCNTKDAETGSNDQMECLYYRGSKRGCCRYILRCDKTKRWKCMYEKWRYQYE